MANVWDEAMTTAFKENGLDFSDTSPNLCLKHGREHGCCICKSGQDVLKDLLIQCEVIGKYRRYACAICFKSYTLMSTLAKHILRHTEAERSSENAFNDTLNASLNNTFSEGNTSGVHTPNDTLNDSPSDIFNEGEAYSPGVHTPNDTLNNSSRNISNKGKDYSPGTHMCYVCLKTFAHQRSLTRHQKLHSDTVEQHVCGVCQKVFNHKRYLKQHKCSAYSKGSSI